MKTNTFLTIISIVLAALVGYLAFHVASGKENDIVCGMYSTICFAATLVPAMGLEYESGSLILVQPESIDEIANEGKTLCHCVGGYAERHAKGITNIMFLRRKTEPDKPFYTVEVSRELKVMQCYGYKNNKAGNDKPPEIEAFEKDYQHYLEELKREQKRNKQKLQQSA